MIGSKTSEEGGTDLDLGEGKRPVSLQSRVPGGHSGALCVGHCSSMETAEPLASSPPPEGTTGPDPAHWGHCDLSGACFPVPLLFRVQQVSPDQTVQGHLFGPLSGLQLLRYPVLSGLGAQDWLVGLLRIGFPRNLGMKIPPHPVSWKCPPSSL